jgi:flavorubredoxin
MGVKCILEWRKNPCIKENTMNAYAIGKSVTRIGAIDWDRRLFDSLIPLPDGTSYNAYLISGSQKTVLVDTVEPTMADTLLAQLEKVPELDYVIAHHAEQDHSGSIPRVLEKYPGAMVIASTKCKGMLVDHLAVPEARIRAVADGEVISLGNLALEFVHTPWVHWPETMCTYLAEEKVLFTCDFFGSHLATTDLTAADRPRVYESAKRYYAEIMMPFRGIIKTNIDKLLKREIKVIAPSHGPIYDDPPFIMNAYKDWISDTPKNEVVVAYISMHGSTRKMVERLMAALTARGVTAYQFDLAVTDLGKLAITLVDAATIVIGTPTVHVGPHPTVLYATQLANALRPKTKFAAVIGSYGWATKAVEQIAALIPNIKAEVLGAVMARGLPTVQEFAELEKLADTIAAKHRSAGLMG